MSVSPSKSEEIIATLRTEILQGQYRPGERLPSERDLSARFQSNRGAIREAIKKLEQLGIVSVAPGGVRVVPVEEATLDVLGHLLDLGEIQRPELIGQIIDVLGAVTALSARSAIEVADNSQIAELEHLADKLIQSVGKAEEHHQYWMQLSQTLMSLHQNLVLRLINNGLRTQFLSNIMNLGFKPDIDHQAVRDALGQLRRAIIDQDANKVSDAIIQHFYIIKTGLLKPKPSNESTRRASNG